MEQVIEKVEQFLEQEQELLEDLMAEYVIATATKDENRYTIATARVKQEARCTGIADALALLRGDEDECN